MKTQQLKGAGSIARRWNGIAGFRLFLTCVTIVTAGLLTGCQDDDAKIDDGDGSESAEFISGTSQSGRVKNAIRTRAFRNNAKLMWVATITAPENITNKKFSATAVAIKDGKAYITWHSNESVGASEWGGAIDVVQVKEDRSLELLGTIVNSDLKFNNVLVHGNQLILSATSAKNGGTVCRVNLENGNITPASLKSLRNIAFPGNSVNAIAEYNGMLIGVSGYDRGTYAVFSPDFTPKNSYNYDDLSKNEIQPMTDPFGKFGGKYVTTDENGDAYVLYDSGDGAYIQKVNGNVIELEYSLLSKDENIDGKHVLAVRNGYAFVGNGKNGLSVCDLADGYTLLHRDFTTVGVYADDNYLYTASGSGLRIYKEIDQNIGGGIWDASDLFTEYAYEVETYDASGMPTSTKAPELGTDTRHSANFVTVDPSTGYIYVAYGKSGVRVYKFRPEDEHTGTDMGDLIWADENIEGYYAWGEIFHAAAGDENPYETIEADEEGLSFTYGETTYTNDATYYPYAQTAKKEYTYNNYHYFNNSVKLMKYTFKRDGTSEDGKTVLEATDDVAAMRWGNGWRMPTIDEWKTLLRNSKVEEVETDGKKGLLITAQNGNKIFLPQTGYYNGRGFRGEGEYYYWSSDLSTQKTRVNCSPEGLGSRVELTGGHLTGGDLPSCNRWSDPCLSWSYEALAWMPDFYYNSMNGYDRCFGFKVRPVKDK